MKAKAAAQFVDSGDPIHRQALFGGVDFLIEWPEKEYQSQLLFSHIQSGNRPNLYRIPYREADRRGKTHAPANGYALARLR